MSNSVNQILQAKNSSLKETTQPCLLSDLLTPVPFTKENFLIFKNYFTFVLQTKFQYEIKSNFYSTIWQAYGCKSRDFSFWNFVCGDLPFFNNSKNF